jgi:hypothetical protein
MGVKYVGNVSRLCFDRLNMRIKAVFTLSLSKGITQTKCAEVLNYLIVSRSPFTLLQLLLFACAQF